MVINVDLPCLFVINNSFKKITFFFFLLINQNEKLLLLKKNKVGFCSLFSTHNLQTYTHRHTK